jgi:tetratricopeptide (TPR) repeat protein
VAVDARADRFALAVTIFEALVGVRPFAGDDVGALAQTKARGSIAWPRRGSPSRALRRVVERALAVDPCARFPDMRALAAALASCAHPRRRRPRLGRAAAALTLGLAGIIGLGALAAAEPRRVATLAPATTGLPLAERLATADALEHARRYDDAIALTSAAIAEREDADEPAAIAALLSRRGSASLRKGAIADAREDLARAYFLAADAGAHAIAARTALRMMVCEASYAAAPAEALVWARHAEAELARAPSMPDATAALEYSRGVAFAALGLATSAKAAFQRAADGYLALHPPDTRRAAFALVELGNTELVAGDHDRAATRFADALALVTAPDRDDDIETAGILERLASVHTRNRRWDDARTLYDRAFVARERVLGRDHFDVALVAYNRAVLETMAGEHVSSEAWFDRAVTSWRGAIGPSSPQLALALDGRGTARQRLGRFAAALDDHEAALAMLEHAVAPIDPRQLAVTSAHAATALGERGAWERAVVRAQQGLEALRSSPVPDVATEQACREILAAAAHHRRRR